MQAFVELLVGALGIELGGSAFLFASAQCHREGFVERIERFALRDKLAELRQSIDDKLERESAEAMGQLDDRPESVQIPSSVATSNPGRIVVRRISRSSACA